MREELLPRPFSLPLEELVAEAELRVLSRSCCSYHGRCCDSQPPSPQPPASSCVDGGFGVNVGASWATPVVGGNGSEGSGRGNVGHQRTTNRINRALPRRISIQPDQLGRQRTWGQAGN